MSNVPAKTEEKEDKYDDKETFCLENVICPCGTEMKATKAETIYESWMPVFCNKCWKHIKPTNYIYSCPRQRCWQHLAGYDICHECAITQQKAKENKKDKNDKNDKNENSKKRLTGRMSRFIQNAKNNKNNVNDNENDNDNYNNDTKENDDDYNDCNDGNNGNENGNNYKLSNEDIELLDKLSPTMKSILMNNVSDFIESNNNNNNNKNNKNRDIDNSDTNVLSTIDAISALTVLQMGTINQLRAYYNDQKNSNYDNLQRLLKRIGSQYELSSKLNENILDFESLIKDKMEQCLLNWQDWNELEIINWLFSLENGKYKQKYENEIIKSINEQNIKGKHLPTLTKVDLQQSWLINDYQDRIDLIQYIEKLCNNTENNHNINDNNNNNSINMNGSNDIMNNQLIEEQNMAQPQPAFADNGADSQIEGQHESTHHKK